MDVELLHNLFVWFDNFISKFITKPSFMTGWFRSDCQDSGVGAGEQIPPDSHHCSYGTRHAWRPGEVYPGADGRESCC